MSLAVRTFLAIPLPQQLQDSIHVIQGQLQTKMPDARWVPPKSLHLTLHFFGAIEQETLEKIKVSVLSVKGCKRRFLVGIKGLGAFPYLHPGSAEHIPLLTVNLDETKNLK